MVASSWRAGRTNPDALAAAAIAGAEDSAVLLAKVDGIPASTVAALRRLAPREIVVVGGERAVSRTTLDSLRPYAARVTRVSGTQRFDTAARLAELATSRRTVYVATGEDYPDALAAAAQAGSEGAAILLVRDDGIPSDTARALTRLRPGTIVVSGGTGSVQQTVLDELRAYAPTVVRRGGGDRYATAAALAEGTPRGGTVFVSVGNAYADALAAAPGAADADGPVLLVTPTKIPAATAQAIRTLQPSRIVLTGSPGAVSQAVYHQLFRLVP